MRYLLPLSFSLAVFGQATVTDLIPIPAGATEGVVSVKLLGTANPSLLPLIDEAGKHLQPQPTASVEIANGVAKLSLKGNHFWGKAGIPNFENGRTLWLQRGPSIATGTSVADAGQPVAVWIYNHETAPVTIRWRLRSGIEAICGMTAAGEPKEDCGTSAQFEAIAIPPATSRAIWIALPERWYRSWHVFESLQENRQAQLELYFGADDKSPVQLVARQFTMRVPWSRLPALWLPAWLQPSLAYLMRLFGTILLVTLGAALLMCAQVIAPGFRKCLALENQLDTLQERLNSISDCVGMRLTARCSRDLKNVRAAILMRDIDAAKPPEVDSGTAVGMKRKTAGVYRRRKAGIKRLFRRIALFGSTQELARVAAFAQSIDTRIRLAERLDELRSEERTDGWKLTPMTLQMMRDDLNAKVEMVVSRQDLAEGDAQLLIAGLTEPANIEKLRSDFDTELEKRVERMRSELGCCQWKTTVEKWLAKLPTAKALYENSCKPSKDGWSDQAIYLRDADTIRLELLYLMVGLEGRPSFNEHKEGAILELLQGSDLGQLKEARRLIRELSEGIFEDEIEAALLAKQWDMWSEPDSPSDLDALKVSLRFRDPRYNRSTAREAFQCLWIIEETDASGIFRDEEAAGDGAKAEPGWDIQFVPRQGKLQLSPRIYRQGKSVRERLPADSPGAAPWRKLEVSVPSRIGEGLVGRVMRGFIDAVLTAIVPVVTVAVTQAQSGAELEWTKLVSIGFTSQAIRSAVLPDPVTPAPAPQAPSRVASSLTGAGTTAAKPSSVVPVTTATPPAGPTPEPVKNPPAQK